MTTTYNFLAYVSRCLAICAATFASGCAVFSSWLFGCTLSVQLFYGDGSFLLLLQKRTFFGLSIRTVFQETRFAALTLSMILLQAPTREVPRRLCLYSSGSSSRAFSSDARAKKRGARRFCGRSRHGSARCPAKRARDPQPRCRAKCAMLCSTRLSCFGLIQQIKITINHKLQIPPDRYSAKESQLFSQRLGV